MALTSNPLLRPAAILLAGLSLSIGWGVRGNWGHEYGAMIPGALTALAVCLLSGREDWRRRAAHFAFFGALGWSFGGSISYMQVIAFTHSGHFPSQIYGFTCLWAIGWCWGSIGGAGTSLPAFLDRKKLTEFYPPLIAIFIAWFLQDLAPGVIAANSSDSRFEHDLNWFDTDWIAATVALPTLFIQAAIRRKWGFASTLILWMNLGWWIGFLVLVNALGLRMTPPRGDNWAGCLGMSVAMILCFARHKMWPAVWASLAAGIIGGLGFSGGQILKLMEIKFFEVDRGYQTNWHSILEQTYGFINGLGIIAAMAALLWRVPRLADGDTPERPASPWADPFALGFVLIVITYVNITKNVESAWLKSKVVPEWIYGQPAQWWFDMAYAALAGAIVLLIAVHRRRPLAAVPRSALGRGQLFYLLFLWWIVLANASRVFPFQPQRLITEGVIHANAILCTLLVLIAPRENDEPTIDARPAYGRLIGWGLALGLLVSAGAIAAQTTIARAMFGDKPTPNASLHIRFGPNATLNKR